MDTKIRIIIKNERIGFAIEKEKTENELEENLKLISALRLVAKHFEDKIIKKFSIKSE